MSTPTPTRIVDAERPWLGLAPYTEATQAFFFGRDREIRDLYLRVRDQALTVLYGQSGLGKTSLLGAGLLPKLRVEGWQPVLLRLRYEAGGPSLLEQVAEALAEAGWPSPGAAGTTPEPPTLWERFHHLPSRPAGAAELRPVLILDQFEEIFTLPGALAGEARSRLGVEAFFHQVADLIENRPPAGVQERLRAQRTLARDYDFGAGALRVLITLREDFLSSLEAWKKILPALMRNRMVLTLLDGPQALEAVVRPGRKGPEALVDDEVGARIVCFVAQKPPGTPLAEIGAVPPLLSLVCDELNEARRLAKAARITAELVERQSADILQNFYARSFAGLHPAVQRLVEAKLVTEVGNHRDSMPREDALARLRAEGVSDPAAALDQLVQGRLLSSEERRGLVRLEITHDVLAPLVARSREERKAREQAEQATRAAEQALQEAEAAARRAEAAAVIQRRQLRRARLVAASFAALGLVAVVLLLWALVSVDRAKKAETAAELEKAGAIKSEETANALVKEASRSDFATAQARFLDGKWQEGVVYLGRSLRYDPKNRNARDALAMALLYGRRDRGALSILSFHHQSKVVSAEFSRDGSRIVTASEDKTAQVWDAVSGQPIGPKLVHEKEVKFAHFSPEGMRVLTVCIDNTVSVDVTFNMAQVWDIATGRLISSMRSSARSGSFISSAQFSPDGTLVVTASEDHTAQVWDAASGERIGPALGHKGKVWDAEFSPDGQRVVTASDDNDAQVIAAFNKKSIGPPEYYAQVWDVFTGTRIGPPLKHADSVRRAQFSPDGARVITASFDRTARIWDAASGQPIGQILTHTSAVLSAQFSPDGTRVLTVGGDYSAQIWDAESGYRIGLGIMHKGFINSAAFSSDGTRVVTASDDETAQVWNAESGDRIGPTFTHASGVVSAQFSPNGTEVVTASSDNTAQLWSLVGGLKLSPCLAHGNWVTSAHYSSDNSRIVTASFDGSATVWDAKSGVIISQVITPSGSRTSWFDANFSPDGAWVVSSGGDLTAQVWDAKSGQQIGLALTHKAQINSAQFSPDGTMVVTASRDNTAQVWNAASSQQLSPELTHVDSHWGVESAQFSPDGKRVVTTSGSTAQVWDAASGQRIGPSLTHTGGVRSAQFSPDGTRIVTASWDNTAQVWNAANGQPIGPALTHVNAHGGVGSAQFSSDGTRVVTASNDYTAQVWDAATGKRIGRSLTHTEGVRSAEFSPDGTKVVTASNDHTAQVWDAASGQRIGPALMHTGNVASAQFSPDGNFVVTSSTDNTARVWAVIAPIDPLQTEQLDRIVKFVSGASFDASTGTLVQLTATQRRTLWEEHVSMITSREWKQLAESAFPTDPLSRVSLHSTMTLREVSTRLLLTDEASNIPSVLAADPAQPLLHIALAWREKNPVKATFLREYFVTHLDDDPQLCRLAVQLLLDKEDKPRAARALEKATRLDPDHPDLPGLRAKLGAP